MSNLKELNTLNTACDDFISGKYILADIKLSSILSIIEADSKLRNIIQSCTSDFNFELYLKNNIQETDSNLKIVLPNEEKQLIAFCYCLLSSIKNGSINFSDFLTKFYSNNNSTTDISEFASEIVLKFKNALNSIYLKTHVSQETEDYQANIYNKLKTNIKLILSNIDNFKLKITEKEEFTMLLNALFIASDKNDKKLVYSLMIGLDYFSKANKRTRNAYFSLEECFA